jgi:hypothetical protein
MKLTTKHIREEWDEGEDGYWIALMPGWKWDGDPVGACHTIHEDTRSEAKRQGVLRCDCEDCRTTADGAKNETVLKADGAKTSRETVLKALDAALVTMPDIREELQTRIEIFKESNEDESFDVLDALLDLNRLAEDVATMDLADAKARRQARSDLRRLVRLLCVAGFYRPITDAQIADEKSRTMTTRRLSIDVEYPKDDRGQRHTSDMKSYSEWLESLI